MILTTVLTTLLPLPVMSSVPSGYPRNVTMQLNESWLVIKWKPPPENKINGILRGYDVIIRHGADQDKVSEITFNNNKLFAVFKILFLYLGQVHAWIIKCLEKQVKKRFSKKIRQSQQSLKPLSQEKVCPNSNVSLWNSCCCSSCSSCSFLLQMCFYSCRCKAEGCKRVHSTAFRGHHIMFTGFTVKADVLSSIKSSAKHVRLILNLIYPLG